LEELPLVFEGFEELPDPIFDGFAGVEEDIAAAVAAAPAPAPAPK
jgi:hypothetical protein